MNDRESNASSPREQEDSDGEGSGLPHERLDVYRVLEEAYRATASWPSVSWAKGGTGDQLRRSASSAILRYTEGYYADGGNKAALWNGARASCGEAAAAVRLLVIDGKVPTEEAARARELFGRAMQMLMRLLHSR
ncbi:MAG: four helix bundle protein [Deltaproteobacteria bacterium]|nr:four helix bundle protein [Deltaproteobacteria bacterium]